MPDWALANQEQAVNAIQATIAERRPPSAEERRDAGEHPYIVLANIAAWLVDCVGIGALDDSDSKRLFAVLDEGLQQGRPEVRELLILGLLEGLQNIGRAKGIPDETWSEFLGDESKRMWQVLDDFGMTRIGGKTFNRSVRNRGTGDGRQQL